MLLEFGSMSRELAPEPRYFSMASMDVGAEVHIKRDLNYWPWVRSLIHSPDAVIHSPAITAAWPTTVVKSRWPRGLMHSRHRETARQGQPGTCGAPLTRCRAPLGPHAAQPRPDVNPGDRLRHRRVCNSFGSYRGAPGEQRQDVVGQESRPWSYRVAAAEAMLVGAEEPQRLNQMEMLLGAGHSDVKQTALFLDLR